MHCAGRMKLHRSRFSVPNVRVRSSKCWETIYKEESQGGEKGEVDGPFPKP